jgi:hypothetical protein
MAEFKPGEKVQDENGETVTVKTLPFTAFWCARADGTEYVAVASALSPIPPADPRVDAAAKALYVRVTRGTSVGWGIEIEGVKDNYREDVRAVLAALDAMKPAEPERVRDRDEDLWVRNEDGNYDCHRPSVYGDPYYSDEPYESVASRYGPLTPIH